MAQDAHSLRTVPKTVAKMDAKRHKLPSAYMQALGRRGVLVRAGLTGFFMYCTVPDYLL